MTKILYIIIFLSALKTIRGQTTFAKTYCDCETVYKDTNYTGYCAEYFDIRLLPALNKKPHFKEYFLYVKGEKIDMWNYYHASKTDKVFLNDHEILENDSIKLLDGILKMVNKKGIIYKEFLYKNGFIQKGVIKDGKSKVNSVTELVEFDYTSFPFKRHAIYKKADGMITYNEYTKFIGGKYIGELTSDTMSEKVEDVKLIP